MSNRRLIVITEVMEGINNAIGYCDQMIHQRGNMKFMAFRDMLHIMKNSIIKYIKDTVVV